VEAFESFVAVALEAQGFVVSEAVKFPVKLQTRKAAYNEMQTHGYEVDLVGARADKLVLATVKSFFGSRGVAAEHVEDDPKSSERSRKLYALLNNAKIRSKVIEEAAKRYGYRKGQVELRLYVGRFAGRKKGTHEERIRAWAAKQPVPIKVFRLDQVAGEVRDAATHKQYRDNPVLVTLKVLAEADMLAPDTR
jgi:hypothetical protein